MSEHCCVRFGVWAVNSQAATSDAERVVLDMFWSQDILVQPKTLGPSANGYLLTPIVSASVPGVAPLDRTVVSWWVAARGRAVVDPRPTEADLAVPP